jgi:ribonuclease HI
MSNLKSQIKQLALDEFNTPTTVEASPAPDTPLKLHVDGSANPNPGIMRLGLVLYHRNEIMWSGQVTLGEGTNNEAEFHAIIRGVALLKKICSQVPDIQHEKCTIITDSRLAASALTRSKLPRNSRLAALYQEAKQAIDGMPNITVCWQPRNRNVSADLVTHNLKATAQV